MSNFTREIIDFWFEPPADGGPDQPKKFWFNGGPSFDETLRARFSGALELAKSGALDGKIASAEDHLAIVIVLDQFPRNMFRGTPDAFACDPLALSWAKAAVEAGLDAELQAPHRRLFLYLPFEHSEDIVDQDTSVRLISALGSADYTQYANAHRDVIREFGRFPHRNNILGRTSTAAEQTYLDKPGSGF